MKTVLQSLSAREMRAAPAYELYEGDLPAGLSLGPVLAMNAEFMGAAVTRDRLCALQLYDGGGKVHIVRFSAGPILAPNLAAVLRDADREKLVYAARVQLKWLGRYLGFIPENIYCLKIASRIARTYTQQHELDDISRQLISVRISRDQQLTDWGAPQFTPAQFDYACNTVLHLHALREKLDAMMAKEGRLGVAQGLFAALPALVRAELGGWGTEELLAE